MTALGAALYHDFAIADDTDPLEAFLEGFFGDEKGLAQFCVPIGPRKERPSAYRKDRLLDRVRAGQLSSFLVETQARTADDDVVTVGFKLVPSTAASRGGYAGYRYRVDVAVGATRLHRRGTTAVVEPLLRLADAIDPRAGVVLTAETTSFAHGLASGAGGMLPPEQEARVTAVYYAVYELDERIRGPEWGTFLGARHVDRLGGMDRVRADSGCDLVRALAGGGAYLQVTESLPEPGDAAVVERLARLETFLAPVR